MTKAKFQSQMQQEYMPEMLLPEMDWDYLKINNHQKQSAQSEAI